MTVLFRFHTALIISIKQTTLRPIDGTWNYRWFRTSPCQKALSPWFFIFFKPVSRFLVVFGGRYIRKWFKPTVKEFIGRHKLKVTGIGLTLGALTLYAYESHVQLCPVTKRRRFVALFPDQIDLLSNLEFENLLDLYADDILDIHDPRYQRVERVAKLLLHANRNLKQIHEKNWTITVVYNSMKNAFVLSSGNIFVFTGMLEMCINDDQLGIVLGHEISHAILGHVAEKLSYATLFNFLILIPLAVCWAFLPGGDGISLITHWFLASANQVLTELPFSRFLETEADQLGLQLVAKACMDVREVKHFWQNMALFENRRTSVSNNDSNGLVEFLSTHPNNETRLKYLDTLVPQAIKQRSTYGCTDLK